MIRSRKPKNSDEPAGTTKGRPSTEQDEQSPRSPIQEYLAEIGRRGGLKGGKARAKSLSAKKRRDIAAKAARTRWDKKRK